MEPASWVLLEKRSVPFSIASDATGAPLLGRPFINALTGNENIYIDAVPGGITGAISTPAGTPASRSARSAYSRL